MSEKSITSATSRQSTILLALFPLLGTLLSSRADSVRADESISQVFEVHPETVASERARACSSIVHTSVSTYEDDSVEEQRTGISGDLGRAHSFVMRIV